MALLLKTLEIGFRLAQPGRGRLAINPDLTSYHDWMFEVAFSSDDDEVIADAVCALIADSDRAPGGSFVRRSSTFIERTTPLSPRLRQAAIRAICCIRPSEPIELPLETALLLNHLEADVDDVEEKGIWVKLLVEVIRSECWILSSHCWRLLDKLTSTAGFFGNHVVRDTEVMRALEDAKDWEKLEVWMGIVWMSLQSSEDVEIPELEEIEQATLRLCVRRLSALQRFEHLCESDAVSEQYKPRLQGKCDNARTERLPLDSPPPPYVSAPRTPEHLSVLMPLFFSFQSTSSRPATNPPSFVGRRHLLRVPVVYTTDWCIESRSACGFFGQYRVVICNLRRSRIWDKPPPPSQDTCI